MRIEELTGKQRRCAELAAEGIPNLEIAALTGMKLRTVKATLGRVFALFGIRDGHKRTKLAVLLNERHPVEPVFSFSISGKEHSIAALVARGLTNKQVAEALETTEHMVKNHMRFLYDLSGMSNRTEFSSWWLANHNAALLYSSIVPSQSSRERAAYCA